MLLPDTIKEMYCKAELITNPFGKLKDACLKLDVVFCPTAQRERGQRRNFMTKDLYIKRPSSSTKCTTETQELVTDNSIVDLCLDDCLYGGGLEIEAGE